MALADILVRVLLLALLLAEVRGPAVLLAPVAASRTPAWVLSSAVVDVLIVGLLTFVVLFFLLILLIVILIVLVTDEAALVVCARLVLSSSLSTIVPVTRSFLPASAVALVTRAVLRASVAVRAILRAIRAAFVTWDD